MEAATIFAGVVIVMSMVTLLEDRAGPEALGTGNALVAMHNWTFLTGQGFLPAVNAVLLGSLLYQSRLVPLTSLSVLALSVHLCSPFPSSRRYSASGHRCHRRRVC